MSKPVVAVIGRPNVGKSTLFNKLIGERLSIVDDTPGVTRDRIYADCEWRGVSFSLIDTGGIEPKTDDLILKNMREQAMIATQSADVIVLVVDLQTGLTAADNDVAAMLRKCSKPIVLAVNKADKIGHDDPGLFEFYNLGLGDPFPVSALHGLGTGDLLDEIFSHFDKEDYEDEESDVIKVALIGKPNVGKSSLVNCILGENRMIVSDIAGTTRDAVDSPFENKYGKFVFVDTAGIRRKSKVTEDIERYSVLRAKMAIDRADVVLIMIDANEGVTEQDTKIAGIAHESGKACIIVVNKWDSVEKSDNTMKNMTESISNDLKYMRYAPVMYISAKTGQRVDKLFEKIISVKEHNSMRITTGVLNDILADAVAKVQPPSDKGKRLKIYYMTQPSSNPPTFVVFVNRSDLFHFSYQRYLENQIREAVCLEGTPVRFIVRERGNDND